MAKAIAFAIEARKPRARYRIGRDAKLGAVMSGPLSDRMFDRLVARNLGLTVPRRTQRESEARTSAKTGPQIGVALGSGLSARRGPQYLYPILGRRGPNLSHIERF